MRRLRAALGLSQEALAHDAGSTGPTLARSSDRSAIFQSTHCPHREGPKGRAVATIEGGLSLIRSRQAHSFLPHRAGGRPRPYAQVHEVQKVQEVTLSCVSAPSALSALVKSFGFTSHRRSGRPAVDMMVSRSHPAFTRPSKRACVWSASRLWLGHLGGCSLTKPPSSCEPAITAARAARWHDARSAQSAEGQLGCAARSSPGQAVQRPEHIPVLSAPAPAAGHRPCEIA